MKRIVLLITTVFLVACQSPNKGSTAITSQQLTSLERLSDLEQDLTALLSLLEQQVTVDNIQQRASHNKPIQHHKKTAAATEQFLQLKLFAVKRHTTSLPRKAQQQKQLLKAIQQRYPSIFTDADIQLQQTNAVNWVTVVGLRSKKEAAVYCRLFALQSARCKQLL